MIEHLEPRVHFAATLHAGTLDVSGTVGDDVISFALAGDEIHAIVNGERTAFARDEVHTLRISAGAGDDRIIVGRWRGRTSIDGGDGDDVISGGRGIDFIDGGAGADAIYGLSGDDWIDPGRTLPDGGGFARDGAPDRISGGLGTDVIYLPEAGDASSSVEQTDDDDTSLPGRFPAHVQYGTFPRLSFLRQGPRTIVHMFASVPDSAGFFELVDVHRHGRTVDVVIEKRRERGGAYAAISSRSVEADLGRLPDGPIRVRVVDRWGGVIRSARLVTPVPRVPVVAPERIHLEPVRQERWPGSETWSMQVHIDLLDPNHSVTSGQVERDGKHFTLDVTGHTVHVGASAPGSAEGTPGRISVRHSLWGLPPGRYTFAVTSGGEVLKQVAFKVE